MTKEEKIIRKKQERKEFKAYIDLSDDRVLNTKKAGIELIAKDEIFVQIPDAEHYWISNYGRLVNNNNKHKTFKFHKMPENNKKVHWTVVSYDIDGSPIHTETNPTELVAKYFLMKNNIARWKVWHIDRNFSNNYYRNLLGGLYRENPVKSRNYEAVKSSKKWENVGNSYIIPALLLYRYSYI